MEIEQTKRNLCISLLGYWGLLGVLRPVNADALSIENESRKSAKISDLQGAISNAIPITLPQTLASLNELKLNVSNYLISEKLDGVRAYWDGTALFFRSGRLIHAPHWFTKDFPDFPIDGELWIGRGQFELVSGITRHQQAKDEDWQKIRYCLFELPLAEGSFEVRYQRLCSMSQLQSIRWISVLEQKHFESTLAVQAYFHELLRLHAEGIVLHQANAVFEAGRTDKLLKFKPYFDAEAMVVKHLAGTGKYQGVMGALLVEDRNGQRFKLGSGFDNRLRTKPPVIGSWVTYRYRDMTGSGLPRFASYLRQYEAD